MTSYKRSVIFIVLGGVFLSTLGIGTRLMESADGMQIVFYRAVGLAFAATLLVFYKHRSSTIKAIAGVGKVGLLAALFLAGASVAIVLAVVNTAVANAMLIISLAPMAAGIFAWIIIGERVHLKTWAAMAVALFGVLIIVRGALSTDGLLGIFFAFIMLICYGMFVVCLRLGKDLDMIPAVSVSAWLLVLLMPWFIGGLHIPLNDLLICLALGVFQVGLGTLLLIAGSAQVPAGQLALLAMLEVVLSPVWVWIGVGERPPTATLIGGAVILLAVSYEAIAARDPVRH